MQAQLPLGIELKPSVDFNSFIAGQNTEALTRLRGEQEPFVYLWGTPGCGKSHLLQAACGQASQTGRQCAYVPLAEIADFEPVLLEGLETLDLVCLDDLERLAGDQAWELALFNLFNLLREQNVQLLVSANAPPAQLPVKLRDLASRLTWGPCYQIFSLDDNGRLELLMRNAEQRGLELSPETASFLLQRIPRDIHSLTRQVEKLDQASLVAQRKLTIPFVRKVLEL